MHLAYPYPILKKKRQLHALLQKSSNTIEMISNGSSFFLQWQLNLQPHLQIDPNRVTSRNAFVEAGVQPPL